MSTFASRISMLGLAAVLALGSATGAEARDHHRHRRGGNGGAVAGAIIGGLALGAVGGALIAPRSYYAPPPVAYVPQQPDYGYGYGQPRAYYAPPPAVYYAPPPPATYYMPSAPRYYGW